MTGARRSAGFTLVEMLVTIAIIGILVSMLALTIFGLRGRAKEKGTEALLEQIKVGLNNYHSEFHTYPPDDADVEVDLPGGGTEEMTLRGSQSLLYHLTEELEVTTYVGSQERTRTVDPFLPDLVSTQMQRGAQEEQFREAVRERQYDEIEILDGWGNPIHYDNTEDVDEDEAPDDQSDGAYWHLDGFTGVLHHGPDPRFAPETGDDTAKNPGAYDLWSHGQDPEDPSDDVTNWN